MLKRCIYSLTSIDVQNKKLDFTPHVLSASLTWGLNASKASAKIALSQESKPLLKTIKRGSAFNLEWGWSSSAKTKVTLYWIGTTWDIGANVSIELVHKSWELARIPVRGIFNQTTGAIVAAQLAAKRGVKINTSLAKENTASTIVSNQSIDSEIVRQFKGQVIKHGFDGTSLEIIDFSNLKDKSQVYYIDTAAGYIGNMTITYKATVPKDKSYIEMLGGGVSSAEPNNNPSKNTTSTPAIEPSLPPGNYALLLSTGNKNKLENPILELKLVLNDKQIGSYPCVSGKAFTQDSRLANNVIPDGEYTIDSKLVAGSVAEVGGKFLGITPKFKTSRSALGIHLDPSYNKNNGEDGTRGCIGLTTAADRDEVHRLILQNNIRTLIVNLKKRPVPQSKSIEPKKVSTAYFIGTLEDNRVIASSNEKATFSTVGSLFKLFIVTAVLKRGLSFTEVIDNKSIKSLVQQMIDTSDNTAANTLISRLGGTTAVSNFCKANGFTSSTIDSNYGSKIGLKQSTARDLFEVFKDLFIKSKANYSTVQTFLSGSGLNLVGETHTKLGFNAQFNGGVSLVEGQSGTKYIVVILTKTETEKLAIAKSLVTYLV